MISSSTHQNSDNLVSRMACSWGLKIKLRLVLLSILLSSYSFHYNLRVWHQSLKTVITCHCPTGGPSLGQWHEQVLNMKAYVLNLEHSVSPEDVHGTLWSWSFHHRELPERDLETSVVHSPPTLPYDTWLNTAIIYWYMNSLMI